MDIKERAELVRMHRVEMKVRRRSSILNSYDNADDYIYDTADGSDASYAAASARWDRARRAAPKDVRRRTQNAPHAEGDYAYGYHGLTARPVRSRLRVNKRPTGPGYSRPRNANTHNGGKRTRYEYGGRDGGFLTN